MLVVFLALPPFTAVIPGRESATARQLFRLFRCLVEGQLCKDYLRRCVGVPIKSRSPLADSLPGV